MGGPGAFVGRAIFFPTNQDGWKKTLLIGGLLTLGGFLFVPWLFVQGYVVRVVRTSVMGERSPPKFGRWGELLLDGAKLFVIQLVYGLVLVGVVLIGLLITVILEWATGAEFLTMVGILVITIAAVLVYYLELVATVSFAAQDDISAAFELGTLTSIGFSLPFFVAALIAGVVGFALGTISSMLTILVVGIFGLFYTHIVVFYMLGQGYTAAGGQTG